ncbi:MAG TPA: DUF4157 domain-containing protein [Nostocaceae cyanobacterium]|nr:DUF4157 domain-containing protein [Nostocaceae cyanobacterium]
MYHKQHKNNQNSSQSAHTPATNQFASSKFLVQPKQEGGKSVSAEEYEKIKSSDGNYLDSSIVTNRPTPKVPRVQPKLKIGQVGDKYEQEADHVAHQVVERINTPQNQSVQSKENLGEETIQQKPLASTIQRQESALEDKETKVNAKGQVSDADHEMAATQQLETSIQTAKGGGQPLADNVRQPMERAFGADFSGVKVHTDARSDQMNQSIQARAFTTGQDLFFRSGEYNPGSRGGQELIAHELTHVVQQGGASQVQTKPVQAVKTQGSSENISNIQRSPVKVAQRASGLVVAKQGIMQNIPGGAKNLENVAGDTSAIVAGLEQLAVQAGGKFGSNADFRTNVAPQIDAAFQSNLANTSVPIDFVETRGANIHWKGSVRFRMGTPVAVGQGGKANVSSSYGGSATQTNKVSESTTDGAKVTGGLKAGEAKAGGEASVGGELSTSTTRATEGTVSTTANRGGTTTSEAMLATYEAPLIAELYLAPELHMSGTDYINPFKWGMALGEAIKPLGRKSSQVGCGKIRYSLTQ